MNILSNTGFVRITNNISDFVSQGTEIFQKDDMLRCTVTSWFETSIYSNINNVNAFYVITMKNSATFVCKIIEIKDDKILIQRSKYETLFIEKIDKIMKVQSIERSCIN